MILTRDYRIVYKRFAAPSPGEVPTSDINQQVFKTFKHVMPGTWGIYHEDKPYEYIKTGGVLLLGQNVKQHGDQYLVSVRWTLLDEDLHIGGLYKEAPTHYHPTRGNSRVELTFGIQGYRPGDEGALGGMIKVNGLPMTPVFPNKIGISSLADTPYEVAKLVEDVIEYYDSGYFKTIPGGVELSKDYYVTENPQEGYSGWKEDDKDDEGDWWKDGGGDEGDDWKKK